MKNVIKACLLTAVFGLFTSLSAQSQDTTSLGQDIKKGVKNTGKAIGKGAKTAGRKTAEVASKGKAEVVDKVYEGKEGPDGQKIYIDKNSRYYWIDKKGHRQFVTETELKDKTT